MNTRATRFKATKAFGRTIKKTVVKNTFNKRAVRKPRKMIPLKKGRSRV